jgi:hypothetical protein
MLPLLATFEESLRWYTNERPTRREKFPSWSWAGWCGEVQWGGLRTTTILDNTKLEIGVVSVEVELCSGLLLSWSDYQAQYGSLDGGNHWKWSLDGVDQPSHYIHVEGFASEITACHIDEQNVPIFSIESRIGEALEFEGLGDRASDLIKAASHVPISSLLAIHLVNVEPAGWATMHEWFRVYYQSAGCALLVCRVGQHWERVLLLSDPKGQIHKAKTFKTKIRLG